MIADSAQPPFAPVTLAPDPDRLLFRFFVPGREEVGPGNSRAGSVIDRLLSLTDCQVTEALADIERQFPTSAHRVWAAAAEHMHHVAPRVDGFAELSEDRQRLIGAAFTQQVAVEGASVCNPSMVLAPDQPGDGSARFIVSVRGIGEGHQSSIGFRAGTIGVDGAVTLDDASCPVEMGAHEPGIHHRRSFRRLMEGAGADEDNLAFVLDTLDQRFDTAQLDERLLALDAQASTRRGTAETVAQSRAVAELSYGVGFRADSSVGERVLWPRTASERRGMEDARFVRFTHDDGTVVYYASYTAFDGTNIAMQLLETTDFVRFLTTPLTGLAASGKGLALFPRRINGRYYALTRADRETNSVASSDHLTCWDASTPLQEPVETWEILQLGNCGPPIETPAGWLVLTHGVGAMRTYAIGAILLDLDDPTQVIGRTREPLITPLPGQSGGYVPNVVYSCGGVLVGQHLVVPYGVNDQRIAITTLPLDKVLGRLLPG